MAKAAPLFLLRPAVSLGSLPVSTAERAIRVAEGSPNGPFCHQDDAIPCYQRSGLPGHAVIGDLARQNFMISVSALHVSDPKRDFFACGRRAADVNTASPKAGTRSGLGIGAARRGTGGNSGNG